jgi:hypothetical protein
MPPLRSKTLILLALAPGLLCALSASAADAPSKAFDLHAWKLQVPGPLEIKSLQNYSSPYFDLDPAKEMCFHLDASEKGTTPDAHFVRSELRHLPNWKTSETHTLSAEVRAVSHLDPDKVTVLQIHGIEANGADAPPLLRVALNKGDLVAVLKTSGEGDQGETIPLLKGLGDQYVKVEITVKTKQLKIMVNGEEKLSRDLSFWKYMNYFKAGCYPQSTAGKVDVMFRKLSAN